MDNTVTASEERGAYLWLFVVGTLSIGLSVALVAVDQSLTDSPREVNLNRTLKEIRSAQASLETGRVDSRLLVTQSVGR